MLFVAVGLLRLHREGAGEGRGGAGAKVPGNRAAADQDGGAGGTYQHRQGAPAAGILRLLGEEGIRLHHPYGHQQPPKIRQADHGHQTTVPGMSAISLCNRTHSLNHLY